jgi:hypothetical protein
LVICPEWCGNISTLRKSERAGLSENLPPPALYVVREQKMVGMLTDATPHCIPRPSGGASPALGWSVIAVKPNEKMKLNIVSYSHLCKKIIGLL